MVQKEQIMQYSRNRQKGELSIVMEDGNENRKRNKKTREGREKTKTGREKRRKDSFLRTRKLVLSEKKMEIKILRQQHSRLQNYYRKRTSLQRLGSTASMRGVARAGNGGDVEGNGSF